MSPPPIWTTSARWSARCRATRNYNEGFVMPRFAANLTMLFTDRPFLERFDAAVRNGFRAVEYMFPYQEDTDGIARALERLKLEQVLFNLPAGDWGAGDRGVAVHPGRRDEFRRGVAQAVDLARRYRCRRVNCLVGKRDERLAYEEQWRCLVDNLRYAAGQVAPHGIMLLVEPINTYDIGGFFLSTSAQAAPLLGDVGAPDLKIPYHRYHRAPLEGNPDPSLARFEDRSCPRQGARS